MSKLIHSNIDWEAVSEGQELPQIELPISYAKVAGHIYATRDWFPGHHDPQYAKAQGRDNIYANTMFFQGFFSRVALNWAGPGWFEHKRSLKIVESVYPGDTLVGKGTVVGKESDGKHLMIKIDMNGSVNGKVAILGQVTVATPLGRDGK